MDNEQLIRLAFNQGVMEAFATVIFNMKHEIIYASSVFTKTLGYQDNELLGMKHEDLCDNEYVLTSEYAKFWENLNNGIRFQDRIIRKSKTNHKVFLEAVYYPVHDEQNNIVAVIKICIDISNKTIQLYDAIDTVTNVSEELQGMANNGGQRINLLKNDISEITKFALDNKDTSLELLNQTEQATDIINVISDVAYQTRMLAINTAIEAARLDNHGGSFAVISKEIRNLSTQVQAEAISIQERISKIADKVKVITNDSQKVLDKSQGALTSVTENTKTYISLNEKAEIMLNQMKMLNDMQEVSNTKNQI